MPQTTPCGEGDVLVQRDQLAERPTGVSSGAMIEVVGRLPEKTRAGTIASARALGAHLVGGLAERQRRGLGEEVGQEQLVHVGLAVAQRVRRVGHRDEVGRDEPGALVDQLVEGVLAVGAGLAPEHLAGVGGHRGAVPAHGLAVGLHGQLLEVRREPVQQLGVGQHGVGLGAEEVDVPDVEQPHERGHVARRARVVRKCSSIAWNPARNSANRSGPIATTTEVPIAESTE